MPLPIGQQCSGPFLHTETGTNPRPAPGRNPRFLSSFLIGAVGMKPTSIRNRRPPGCSDNLTLPLGERLHFNAGGFIHPAFPRSTPPQNFATVIAPSDADVTDAAYLARTPVV